MGWLRACCYCQRVAEHGSRAAHAVIDAVPARLLVLHEALDHHEAGAADRRRRAGKCTERHYRRAHGGAKCPHAASFAAVKPALAPRRQALCPATGEGVWAACT